MANLLLDAMNAGTIDAVICRAPEFYGPGKTQSLTNTAIFDRIKEGERPMVPINAHTRRSLIWTPDASRAMGLIGNTPDAYGQTWHLPIDPDRQTYAGMIEIASEILDRPIPYRTVPLAVFKIAGLFKPAVKEANELMPRYRQDNIFESTKFAERFPEFKVTSYREGIAEILAGR